MGGIVTSNRITDAGFFPYSVRYEAQAYTPERQGHVAFYPYSQQTTTSYRSKGGTEDTELEEDTHVTRNGFTSFDPQTDWGHEFFTTRTSVKLTHPDATIVRDEVAYPGSNAVSGWKGPLVVAPAAYSEEYYPSVGRMTNAVVRNLGQRAINSSAPTAPSAQLAVALGEAINDGIPKVSGTTIGRVQDLNALPKAVGEEHLNFTFAIVPLVSDIRKLMISLSNRTKILRQLQADSGKNVRRRFYFPDEDTISGVSEYTSNAFSQSAFVMVDQVLLKPARSGVNGGARHVSQNNRVQTKTWFSGCFTYHIAKNEGVWGRLEAFEQKANKLLGLRLNAEALWNLTPWSWLVDWQATIGEALATSSLLAEDGLVLRYGYLMRHTIADIVRTADNASPWNGRPLGSVTTILRREQKERVKATPFGFGLDLSALNVRQWAILGALGMTKGDKRLR